MDKATRLQDAIGIIDETFIAEISQHYSKKERIRARKARLYFPKKMKVRHFPHRENQEAEEAYRRP